jgi:DNA-directed RNA polymerase subunit RPC12/RpoP
MKLMNVSSEMILKQRELASVGETDGLHYCYRCYICGRLVTKLEILEAHSAKRINVCPCGSKQIQITNPKRWEELLLPRCWKLIAAIYLKKISLAPQPPTHEEQQARDRAGRAAMRQYDRQVAQMMKQ